MIGPIRSREVFRRFDRRAARRRSGPITVLHVPHDRARDHAGSTAGASSEAVGVAYAVSRKVGSAVHRNRIRRQLREIFRGLDRAGAVPPGWYLVIVHPGAVGTPFAALSDAVRVAVSEVRGAEK